tara:strand:- start:1279 stop:1932 length:654 start_codon:yes stop_codon:yes gene_type:complete
MNKKQRVSIIIDTLEDLYPDTPIPLNHINNFTLLIAVLLSAQTTDKKVNEVSSPLFKKASDPLKMISLGEKKIYGYIKQLGLSKTKAKHIYNLSIMLRDKYNCIVPKSFIELESLPGVGHKTSSVVMAQAFKIPTFPVDTHIHRLAQRWGLTSGINVKETEKDLKTLFPKPLWNKIHLQIIFYGREFCTARRCDGTICKLCRTLFPYRQKPIKCIKA